MKFLRDFLDKIEPHFKPGGKLEQHYPGFEAADTFLYTPGETAEGGTHVRDSIDLKRLMITVVIALLPCIFMAMYNTGYQANKIIAAAANPMKYDGRVDMNGDQVVDEKDADGVVTREELPEEKEGDYTPKSRKPSMRSLFGELDLNGDGKIDEAEAEKAVEAETLVPAIAHADWTPTWSLDSIRYKIMDSVGVSYSKAGSFGGNFIPSNWGTMFACLFHGALYFLPIYIVTMAVGGNAEMVFSVIRKHEVNEGFLVTGMLYPLTLPCTTPLWQVAVGIIFGVVIGKEIFGGTGRNFLNPALTARAFLYFAYPVQIVGSKPWVSVDGYSGATVLGALADAPSAASGEGSRAVAQETVANTMSNMPVKFEGATVMNLNEGLSQAGSFMNFFWGDMHGSMGETSTFCCLLGAAILIATGIGSWRIMAGCVIGLLAAGGAVWGIGGEDAVFNVAPHWHLVIGSFAFGAVFMATDPVSAAMTNTGRWIYGILIGAITIMVRIINPAFPEGVMLAILFGNVCAPLIDYWVVQQNVKRRLARNDA